MIVSKKALPRRTFLRGVGTLLSLPLLDAMVPSMTALSSTAAAPERLRRLGFVYMPMGCDIARWTPSGTTLDELSPILSPLAAVRQHVTAITNLDLRNAYPGTHATSNAAFLSANKLHMPILAYGGAEAFGRGPETLASLTRVGTNVRGGIVERCGHWIPEEQPEFLLERVLPFLQA